MGRPRPVVTRLVFVTGTTWSQEGQTTETMTRRDDGGYDIAFEYTNMPGRRELVLDPPAAEEFAAGLEATGALSWESDIYEAPEPQGVRWSLLVEGEGFETLALQGATHAFPAGFPNFVALMGKTLETALAQGPQRAGAAAPAESGHGAAEDVATGGEPIGGRAPYLWEGGAIQPEDFPFAHSK